MAQFKWLWLNTAVDVVAQRLAQAEPNRLSDPEVAIAAAQEEILAQAALGALEIHGMPSDPDAEVQPQNDWEVVHASYWKESHRIDWTNSDLDDLDDEVLPEKLCTEPSRADSSYRAVYDPIVVIEWQYKSFTFEMEGVVVGGFHSLKVRTQDIDRIWPPPAVTQEDRYRGASSIGLNATTEAKNKGGQPPKYRGLFLELIRIANTPNGLPLSDDNLLNRPSLKRQLQEFGISYWGPDDEPSDSLIDSLLKEVADWLAQKR